MRSYQQFCGVAKTLDLVGDRWTLLIVRDLLLGPRRYSQLHRELAGITTNLLAARLKHLTEQGLVESARLHPGAVEAYALTNLGRQLEPVITALGAFGGQFMDVPAQGERVSPRWAMVSMQRRYGGSDAQGRVQFELEGLPFKLDLSPDKLVVQDGSWEAPDASLTTNFSSFAAGFFGGRSLEELRESDHWVFSGDVALLEKLHAAVIA